VAPGGKLITDPKARNKAINAAYAQLWRAQLRDVNKGGTAYWRAGNKYQLMLVVSRFRDNKRPTEERYLITLGIHRSRGVQ